MNWVLLLVLLILGYNIIRGYRKGFLRIVYSLVSWVIVLTFVTVATPYINTYLMEHTTLYEKIEQQCSEQIKRSVEEKQRSIQKESSPDNQELSQFGIMLPDSVVNDIFEKTGNMAGEIIEQSGLYDEIAKQIAEFVVEGIAFLIALVAAWTIVHVIARALRIVSRIPVLSGVNRTLGVFAGFAPKQPQEQACPAYPKEKACCGCFVPKAAHIHGVAYVYPTEVHERQQHRERN